MENVSDYCWSNFMKTKDEIADKVLDLLKELKKIQGINVKKIRCENAGENKVTVQFIKKDFSKVTIE